MAEQQRLERQNGIIAGVCGGIAVRFGVSPFIIRLIFFILLLPGGLPGLVPYLILWILMPKRQA
jgi:phage shock protein C